MFTDLISSSGTYSMRIGAIQNCKQLLALTDELQGGRSPASLSFTSVPLNESLEGTLIYFVDDRSLERIEKALTDRIRF